MLDCLVVFVLLVIFLSPSWRLEGTIILFLYFQNMTYLVNPGWPSAHAEVTAALNYQYTIQSDASKDNKHGAAYRFILLKYRIGFNMTLGFYLKF